MALPQCPQFQEKASGPWTWVSLHQGDRGLGGVPPGSPELFEGTESAPTLSFEHFLNPECLPETLRSHTNSETKFDCDVCGYFCFILFLF
jgi:hypothetical protein